MPGCLARPGRVLTKASEGLRVAAHSTHKNPPPLRHAASACLSGDGAMLESEKEGGGCDWGGLGVLREGVS